MRRRLAELSTLMLLASGAVIVPAGVVDAASPGANGLIAFSSIRSGDSSFRLYTMKPDGSSQTGTAPSTYVVVPRWSPDGTKIVFQGSGNPNDVWVMNADGTDIKDIGMGPVYNGQPVWSPDGTRIAFTSDRDGRHQIYVMNADGSNQQNISNSLSDDFDPSWSPDGTLIAFTSNRAAGHNWEIYVMHPDGSGQTNLTNNPSTDDFANWSPDGTRLAFSGGDGVFVMNRDGSGRIRLTHGTDVWPVWSPDGSAIAFGNNVRDDASGDIYVMNADGSNIHNISNAPGVPDVWPDWQPLPLPPQELLVGLGDSIAAGHGLGFARGVNADHPAGDNPGAYPHVLGRRLGWNSVDFAVTGACAASAQDPRAFGSTPTECNHSVLSDQLPQLEASGLYPSLITQNVGANDIRFVDCILWYIAPVKPVWLDPCENRNLHVHLAALQRNLSLVLTELYQRFPDVPVVITKYYNPLPRPPSRIGGSDTCRPLYLPLALVQHTQLFLSGPAARELAVRQTQTEAWSFAQRVVTELNATLDAVALNARGNVRTTAAPDFSGHDLCHVQTGGSVKDAWVFGPRLNLSYFWHFLLRSGSGNFNVSMPSACQDEEYEPDWSPLFGSVGENREPISSWSVFATFHTNCAPHPTQEGQDQLAQLVLAVL